ncbi:MAG: hypothetical protein IJR35_01220, partial [Synergistaceae bacterium]|nr:hypothetical protein [Synergistaceae bacterium]
ELLNNPKVQAAYLGG